MNRSFFNLLYPYLDKLSLGNTLRKIIYWLWKISAIAYGILAIYFVFLLMNKGQSFSDFATGTLVSILIITAWWIIAQIFFYRADKVRELEDSDFTVLPIFSQLFRLSGELISATIIIMALVAIFLSNYSEFQYLSTLPLIGSLISNYSFGNTLSGNLILILIALTYSFGILIIFYLLAELFNLQVVIANNSAAIRKMLQEIMSKPLSTKPADANDKLENIKTPELRCHACSNVVQPEDIFCMHCGNELK